MIGMVRDAWRAVLVVVVVIVLREVLADRPAPSQPVAAPAVQQPMQTMPLPGPMPQWQQAPGYGNPYQQQAPEQRNDRPLRRIGSAVIELGDSLIGAVRR